MCRVRLLVTKVKKPLLSVGRMCDAGNRIVFEQNGGYIQHLATNETVHFKRVGSVYSMEVDIVTEPGSAQPGSR